MAIAAKVPVHIKETEIANGGSIDVTHEQIVKFTIAGSSTSFTVAFEASDDGGQTYYPVMGTKCNDYTASSTTASETGEAWELEVGAWGNFRARIVAIGNGYLTITAVSAM